MNLFLDCLNFPRINPDTGKEHDSPLTVEELLLLWKACKITKLLACGLENIVPTVVSQEQTGFVKGWQLFFNIRTLLNITDSKTTTPTPEVLISVDTEKAFERVEWKYLFTVLKKFGLGNGFVSWIRLLYPSPQASISTNGIQSSFFSLSCGTRQRCPGDTVPYLPSCSH